MRRSFALLAVATLLALAGLAPPAATAAVGDWQRGANFTSWWHDQYEQPASDAQLAALRERGASHAMITATWYMETATSSGFGPDALKTASDASVLHAAARARSLGLAVVLKPMVDVRDGTWRGAIAPADPAAWFADYRRMTEHYAALATQAGASLLVVGTEFSTMEPRESDWRAVIATARAGFAGPVTYGANWDTYAAVRFWDALDYVGIDAYFPVSEWDPNPSVEELVRGWRATRDSSGRLHDWVAEIGTVQAAAGRPVLFVEFGYQSREGTAVRPWSVTTGPVSQDPQARAFEAAFRVWSGVPWLAGIHNWNWEPRAFDPAGVATDPSHRFQGKLADSVVATWFGGSAPAPDPTAGSPEAALTAPADGDTFTSDIAMAATASAQTRIDRVEFFVDRVRVASDRSAPYTATWRAAKSTALGTHEVTARAYDSNGLTDQSSVTVTRVASGSGGKPPRSSRSSRSRRATSPYRVAPERSRGAQRR